MSQIVIRDLPEETEQFLRRRAERSGRTLEAEVRELLRSAAGSGLNTLSNEHFAAELFSRLRDTGLTQGDWEEFERSLKAIRHSRHDSLHRWLDFDDPKWDP